jgi:hypothetical protein
MVGAGPTCNAELFYSSAPKQAAAATWFGRPFGSFAALWSDCLSNLTPPPTYPIPLPPQTHKSRAFHQIHRRSPATSLRSHNSINPRFSQTRRRHNVRSALRPLHPLWPGRRCQQRWQPAYCRPPSRASCPNLCESHTGRLTNPSRKSTRPSTSCATTSTRFQSAVSASTVCKTRRTIWPSRRRASDAAPTESESRCGGRT